jgi:hypothetical protein
MDNVAGIYPLWHLRLVCQAPLHLVAQHLSNLQPFSLPKATAAVEAKSMSPTLARRAASDDQG